VSKRASWMRITEFSKPVTAVAATKSSLVCAMPLAGIALPLVALPQVLMKDAIARETTSLRDRPVEPQLATPDLMSKQPRKPQRYQQDRRRFRNHAVLEFTLDAELVATAGALD
jgi:hypothetical protein